MIFQSPIMMNSKEWTFENYCSTLATEQEAARHALEEDRAWIIPQALSDKVDEQGHFRPFFGDTTVFTLTRDQLAKVSPLIDIIERSLSILATPLDKRQLHMTLHDLSNSPIQERVAKQLPINQEKASSIIEKIKKHIEKNPSERFIKMRSCSIYPSLNIALLLGMIPASREDFLRLIHLYQLFDEVVSLSYWLRPHITLSYFRPIALDHKSISEVNAVLKTIGSPKIEMTFDILELSYQHFFDMNNYVDIVKF